MSLDVYLEMEEPVGVSGGIYIRENGRQIEISRKEWDKRYPGREPVAVQAMETSRVFSANITHNLSTMAGEAGIYMYLWRPDEVGITFAGELIEPLTKGLLLLRSDPERFKAFNPSNGWGDYKGLCEFVQDYLMACKRWPQATVGTWR